MKLTEASFGFGISSRLDFIMFGLGGLGCFLLAWVWVGIWVGFLKMMGLF